jgi:DNA-binding CsgD family transcriptional regulator
MSRPFRGDIYDGLQRVAEAETNLEANDPLGLLPMAWGLRALLHAMGGNPDRANERIDMAEADPRGAQTRVSVWTNRARAWIAANDGDTKAASALAEHAGRLAAAGTHYVWSAFAYHDAVRFGGADIVRGPLSDLAAEDRGPLVQLLADHATAVVDRDLTRLRDVIDRARAIGAEALAAEGHAAASVIAPGVEGVRHAHLAGHHHRRCRGLRSPLLDGVPSPITERQGQIAALASMGYSSKDIAAKLHLSARTIDNHLRAVYRIFEINGRMQLPDLFSR